MVVNLTTNLNRLRSRLTSRIEFPTTLSKCVLANKLQGRTKMRFHFFLEILRRRSTCTNVISWLVSANLSKTFAATSIKPQSNYQVVQQNQIYYVFRFTSFFPFLRSCQDQNLSENIPNILQIFFFSDDAFWRTNIIVQ